MHVIMLSVCSVDIVLHLLLFRKFIYSGFFYKEKRDLEMCVFREAKQKIWTDNVHFFRSFRYAMECTRTIGFLIKIVRKDIILQLWKFQSFTRVLLS